MFILLTVKNSDDYDRVLVPLTTDGAVMFYEKDGKTYVQHTASNIPEEIESTLDALAETLAV